MPIVFAAMAPHGFTLIPDMHPSAEGGMATRAAMEEMGRRMQTAAPEVIVVATPHGFRVDGAICVSDAARGAGAIRWNERTVEQNVPFDRELAIRLADKAAAAGIPVAKGSYGGGGAQGVLPLDWGVITPLWFAAYPRNMCGRGDVLAEKPARDDGPAAVVVCPARNLQPNDLIAFGRTLADVAAEDGRRIAYIASCDWSHRHLASGPYGFSEVAAPADARIVAAMRGNDLRSLEAVTPEEIAAAAMDGIPQTLILAGVIEQTGLAVDLLSYEAPTYYGMIVATYQNQ
jgi:aromatic ring-opening dioxygenase LigB subunit